MQWVELEDCKELKEYFYIAKNTETFARAWLDGYTVEKEKKYTVKLKQIRKGLSYLICVGNSKNWVIGGPEETTLYKTKHTRKELEEAGFGEVFNSPLFEVEEVK